MEWQTEVVIIGGGATGVGIARDLSLRGIPCILIEKGDLTTGASGRNHGLLHSGARYAVSDPEAAKECIGENKILRVIAPDCIEETGGLFISLPEDDLEYRDRLLRACEQVGIPARLLSRVQALDLEPALRSDLLGAVEVPDGSIDPFLLVMENAYDAEQHGARFLLHTEVRSIEMNKGKVVGVGAKDLLQGEEHRIEASYVVNATGAWANQLLNLVGLRLDMALSKGSMIITNQRMTQRVINRCRRPSDGDILVPNGLVSILGTTSIRVDDIEHLDVTSPEVCLLIGEISKMIPAVSQARFIRAYAGIRPLVFPEEKEDDRAISRGFALIDHETRDGIRNLITVTGGKLITYRLMAERTADLLCQKMGMRASCSTHLRPLPGKRKPFDLRERLKQIGSTPEKGIEIICDCEIVGREELEETLEKGGLRELQDVLHRTRLAKGTCQGAFCAYRLLGLLHELKITEGSSTQSLKRFLDERWRGVRPILWGTPLKEEELIESIYKGIFNLSPTHPFPLEG